MKRAPRASTRRAVHAVIQLTLFRKKLSRLVDKQSFFQLPTTLCSISLRKAAAPPPGGAPVGATPPRLPRRRRKSAVRPLRAAPMGATHPRLRANLLRLHRGARGSRLLERPIFEARNAMNARFDARNAMNARSTRSTRSSRPSARRVLLLSLLRMTSWRCYSSVSVARVRRTPT